MSVGHPFSQINLNKRSELDKWLPETSDDLLAGVRKLQ
jgi:hypothetical protein